MKEITIGSTIFILVGLVMFFGLDYALDKRAERPCESFSNTTLKNVPAKCYSHFNI